MRKESVVVVAGAVLADRDLLDPELRRVLGYQGAEVDVPRTGHGLTGELLPNFNAYLVAPATNRGTEVDRQFVWWKAEARQSLNCFRRDARCSAAPS
jgi:hypothetical protein